MRLLRSTAVSCMLAVILCLTASGITYPSPSAFLYGNSAVNQAAQTSYVSGPDGSMDYRLLTPKNYDATVKYPLIVFLHGAGFGVEVNGAWNEAQLLGYAGGAMALVSTANPDNRTNYPCFFVVPQTRVNNWNRPSDIASMIETLKTYYSIDADRICLTGLSLGALGSWQVATALPTTFASLVPMAGGGSVNTLPKLPVWAFQAANDTVVPAYYLDNTTAHLRNRGFSVVYTRYTLGGHVMFIEAYKHPQLMPWIYAQRRGQAVQSSPDLTITGMTRSSPMTVTGTTATDSDLGFTRVGWLTTKASDLIEGSDGVVTSKTFTNSDPDVRYDSSLVGCQIELPATANSGVTPVTGYFDIVAVVDEHTLTLSETPIAGTNLTYAIYTPDLLKTEESNLGEGAADWASWTVSPVPGSGKNWVHVLAEAPSGSTSYGGTTTVSQSVAVDADNGYYGFSAWQTDWWPEGGDISIIGQSADADADGLSNLLEYALGLDPTKNSQANLPEVSVAENHLRITFTRLADKLDIVYTVEASSDLQTWSEIWSSATTTYGGDAAPSEKVTVADTVALTDEGISKRFLRVRVTR